MSSSPSSSSSSSTSSPSSTTSSSSLSEVKPFTGYVETTLHALRLIYAARQGVIPRITRRLNDAERKSMIKSGAVFVFGVEESGIKRWTDGLLWSPSRIVGNFLVYREINERASGRGNHRRSYPSAEVSPPSPSSVPATTSSVHNSYRDHRAFRYPAPSYGSADPGTFKPNGLIKKTITVTVDGSDLHLISYYTSEDIRTGRLKKPTSRPDIMMLDLPPGIFRLTNFRNPPKVETGPDGRLRLVADTQESESMSLRETPYRMATTSPAWSTPAAALASNHAIGSTAQTASNGSLSEHHHSRIPFAQPNGALHNNTTLSPSVLLHHLPHSHAHPTPQARFEDDLTSSWATTHLDVLSPSATAATPTLSPSSPPSRPGDMMWSVHGLGGGTGTDLGGDFLDEGWNAWTGEARHARWTQQGYEDYSHHAQHAHHHHHHHHPPHAHHHHPLPHSYPTLWSPIDPSHAPSPHSHSSVEMEDLLFGTGAARATGEFGYPSAVGEGKGEKEKERGGGGGGEVVEMVGEMEMAYVC